MKKLAAPMKSFGNLILMAVICVVIFWIFMALRPAQADAVYDDLLCRVMDPTGTPLNVRATPNGPVVGMLNNGKQVIVFDPPTDRTDKSWVYVRNYEDGKPIGWVFRKFIACERDWSGCKEDDPGPQNDEAYYSCENGHDFEFFKDGYKRGGRICKIDKFEELPGTESPRLVWATCKEDGIEQFEVSKFSSCCGVLMIKRLYVWPEITQ
jgi:hypothetical protein